MTMSTIGYGDLVPTTAYSKIFTMVYAMLSIGVFVAIVTKLVMVIVSDKKAANERRRHKKIRTIPGQINTEGRISGTGK